MTDNIQIQITKPFGPSIAKVKMPLELINKLNNYIDDVISDETKYKNLDYGNKLAGNVKQEFKLENDFVEESRFLEFLLLSTKNWIKLSGLPEIKKFELLSSWAVRQFKNEYNPVHTHSGHVSGVGYLKVPNDLGSTVQNNKKINPNGTLELIHGAKMFLSNSTFKITPKVGDFYFFPNYMMHSVYPFTNSNEERRSVSFNARVDEQIYDSYAK